MHCYSFILLCSNKVICLIELWGHYQKEWWVCKWVCMYAGREPWGIHESLQPGSSRNLKEGHPLFSLHRRRQWEKRDIYRQYPDAPQRYISLSLQKTSMYQAIFQTHPWHFISSMRISEQTYAGRNIMTSYSAIFSGVHGWAVLTEDNLAGIKYACGKGQRFDS